MGSIDFEESAIDGSLFVGVVYDLAQPIHLHGEDYETLSEIAPDAAYVVKVHYRLEMLVKRFRSLVIINLLLSYDSFPIETPLGVLSRENWVRVTLDVLLARLTSIRDCAFLLINELFELGIDYRRVSRRTLLSHATISPLDPLCSSINNLAEVGQNFREERNYHFHRGEERTLGDDPITYYIASAFEAFGSEISGTDMLGNAIDLEGKHKIIIEQLQTEFSKMAFELEDCLSQLFEIVYPYFLRFFRQKYELSANPNDTAEGIISRAEYYHSKHKNQEIATG